MHYWWVSYPSASKDNLSHTLCRWYLGRCAHELWLQIHQRPTGLDDSFWLGYYSSNRSESPYVKWVAKMWTDFCFPGSFGRSLICNCNKRTSLGTPLNFSSTPDPLMETLGHEVEWLKIHPIWKSGAIFWNPTLVHRTTLSFNLFSFLMKPLPSNHNTLPFIDNTRRARSNNLYLSSTPIIKSNKLYFLAPPSWLYPHPLGKYIGCNSTTTRIITKIWIVCSRQGFNCLSINFYG